MTKSSQVHLLRTVSWGTQFHIITYKELSIGSKNKGTLLLQVPSLFKEKKALYSLNSTPGPGLLNWQLSFIDLGLELQATFVLSFPLPPFRPGSVIKPLSSSPHISFSPTNMIGQFMHSDGSQIAVTSHALGSHL